MSLFSWIMWSGVFLAILGTYTLGILDLCRPKTAMAVYCWFTPKLAQTETRHPKSLHRTMGWGWLVMASLILFSVLRNWFHF